MKPELLDGVFFAVANEMALRQGSVLSGRSGSMERAPSFGRATSGAVLKVRIKEAFDAVDADGNGVCGGTTALCSSLLWRIFGFADVDVLDGRK